MINSIDEVKKLNYKIYDFAFNNWTEYSQQTLPYSIFDFRVCRKTNIKDSKGDFLYTGDMIDVILDKDKVLNLIVTYHKGFVYLREQPNIYIDGIVLMDYNGKYYLMGKGLIDVPENIVKTGNIFENNMQDIINIIKEDLTNETN